MVQTSAGPSARLVGFGVGRAMLEVEARGAGGGASASFSPDHGAPEQFTSQALGLGGPWTDVHALGLILVELVSGRPAYDGASPTELLRAANADPRPTPGVRGAVGSEVIESVCARALARAPRDRFPSAGELLAALDAALAGSATAPRATQAGTEVMPLDDETRRALRAAAAAGGQGGTEVLSLDAGTRAQLAQVAPTAVEQHTVEQGLDDVLREQLRAAAASSVGTEAMPMDDALRAQLLSQSAQPDRTRRARLR